MGGVSLPAASARRAKAPRLMHLRQRAARAIQQASDDGLADLALTSGQAGALFVVPTDGAVSVNAVAEALGLAQSAASVLVQRLESQGLVARTTDPDDRRAVRLVLTAKGRAVRTRAAERAGQFNARLARGFTAAELETVARFLEHARTLKEKSHD